MIDNQHICITKKNYMISNFTVVTIPQWAIFAAITITIYGWVEQKKIFSLMGIALMMLLGIFAAWVIYSGWLIPESMFDTTGSLDGEELFSEGEIPMEGRMLPFYWGLVVNGLLSVPVFLVEYSEKKYSKPLKLLIMLTALMIFFGMTSASRL